MTNKIEEVKKILKKLRVLDEIDATSYQAGVNSKRNLDEAAHQICKLFEPHIVITEHRKRPDLVLPPEKEE